MRVPSSRHIAIILVVVVGIFAAAVALPLSEAAPPQQDGAQVFAQAVGQANLRGGPGVEYPVVGEIEAGARYRVTARHTARLQDRAHRHGDPARRRTTDRGP